MSDNDTKIINHSITRLLARREHSKSEIMTKLLSKGYDAELVKQQLALFVEKNIQSDERFVEVYIRSKMQKGHGKKRIKMSLSQHDIDENLIESGFAATDDSFFDTVIVVYQKKYGDKPIADWKDKQKRMRFLQYRGFTAEQINVAIAQKIDE